MPHYNNFNLVVCKTDWVNQDLVNHNWQSDALQPINLRASFEADRQAGSLTAQTYYQTKLQSCKSEL